VPAVVTAFKAGARLAQAVPAPVATFAGRAIGLGIAHTDADRRRIVERNLQRIYGGQLTRRQLRRHVQLAFDSYARYWVEAFRLPGISSAEIDAGMSVDGFEHLEDAKAAGRGAVIALPHLGGWEWGGTWIASQGLPMTVVAETLEPPELFEWFVELRERLGIRVLALGPDVGTKVLGALRDNLLVGLLCDRDIGGGGIEVEFFGERTTLPGGPVTMALRTGAALLPTAVYFRGDAHHAVVRPPMDLTRQGGLREDVTRLTQALAHELERLIAAAPEQWHVFQPNWPSDR
jgi:KDO2-lipid IV(A) lauroyltransferase